MIGRCLRRGRRAWLMLSACVVLAGIAAHLLAFDAAAARDVDGRYANSPLKSWFEKLASGKGACCADADGQALSDVDWQSSDGHYRVRLDNEWRDVPDAAVITEPVCCKPRATAKRLLPLRSHSSLIRPSRKTS